MDLAGFWGGSRCNNDEILYPFVKFRFFMVVRQGFDRVSGPIWQGSGVALDPRILKFWNHEIFDLLWGFDRVLGWI